MLGTIPPGRVVVDLTSRLFVASLTGYIPGEPCHREAPLTVAPSFLTAPDMTRPPPLIRRPRPRERRVASLHPVDGRGGTQGEAFPGNVAEAWPSDDLSPNAPSQLAGPDLTSGARARVLLIRPFGSPAALSPTVDPYLPVDAGVEALQEATLGRIGVVVTPAAEQPRKGRKGRDFLCAGLAGDGVHGLTQALHGWRRDARKHPPLPIAPAFVPFEAIPHQGNTLIHVGAEGLLV
jgi:hypothetical protein